MKKHDWSKRARLIVIILTITGCATAVWGQATVPHTLYIWYEEQLENVTKKWQEKAEMETTKYQLELISQIREEIEGSIGEIEAYMAESQKGLQAELEHKKEEQLLLYKEKKEQAQQVIKDQINTTTSSALCIEVTSIEERENLYVQE